MSFVEMNLIRQRRSNVASVLASHYHRPQIDVLEARECLAVAAPTGVQLAVLSMTQVKLTWNDVANESGYRIFRWTGTQSVLAGTVGADVKTFTANGLLPNQTQWFTVQAFDASSSATSAWASIKTPANAITVPTNVNVASATQTTLTLTWGDATGETGYRIFIWEGNKATQVGSVAANTTAFQVQNLTAGQSYYFYIQAFNANNIANTAWIGGSTLTMQFTGPTNVQAQTAGTDKINLSWNDGNGEAGYRVFRWNGSSSTSPELIATLGANITTYQATGLSAGQEYWFYVQGFNSANTVANSAWASATTTPFAPLQAPSQVRVNYAGRHSAIVSWTEPALAVGYRVYLWNGFSWLPVQIAARGTTAVRIDNLAAFRTHWFMVQSFTDNFAQVAYSNAVYVNL